MPKVELVRRVFIKAAASEAYAQVRDFKRWSLWSPWLVAEPDCPMTYRSDGSGYGWDGKIIGSGEIVIEEEKAGEWIDLDLRFFKPWKSQAKTRFDFVEKDGGTQVSWTMDTKLPFFMFFMRKWMEAYIGLDYDRGLAMLKDLVELGNVPVKVEFLGKQESAGCHYLGIENTCDMAKVGEVMSADMQRLFKGLGEAGIEPAGQPQTLAHKWDFVNKKAHYTVSVPVTERPSALPPGFTAGEIPAGPVYQVRYTGPYRHLANPWSAAMMHSRAGLWKAAKGVAPFEIYLNNPDEVSEDELVTLINLPMR